jgi:hypothetical protein
MTLARANASFDLVSDRLVFCNFKHHNIKLSDRKEYLESVAHLIRNGGLFLLRVAAPPVADYPLRLKNIALAKNERTSLNALFQPACLSTRGQNVSPSRASRSSRWMPMLPNRGGNATAAAVFLLAAKKRQRTY